MIRDVKNRWGDAYIRHWICVAIRTLHIEIEEVRVWAGTVDGRLGADILCLCHAMPIDFFRQF